MTKTFQSHFPGAWNQEESRVSGNLCGNFIWLGHN